MKPMRPDGRFPFVPFQKKHGTIERWIWCTCDECVTARAPLDQALAEERARREAPPSWHKIPCAFDGWTELDVALEPDEMEF